VADAKSIHEIVALASAFYGSATLFAALEKGVFAAAERVHDLDGLAAACGCSARGLRLVLDACVAQGLLEKRGDEWFNTPAGRLALVPGAPADLSRAIAYNRDVYPVWGRLVELMLSGAPPEAPEIHLGGDPERTRRFALSMRGRAFAIGRGVVPLVALGAEKGRLLDLAGGPGAYAELLARANPGWTIETVDVPAISAVAAECIREAGLADRVTCRAGDYHTATFDSAAYDAVTLFGCLHQESPEDILSILRRVRTALRPGGRVFVLDMMTDATHTVPTFSAMFAVNMALTTRNGWVFSDDELKGWMTEAGFEPGPTVSVPPPMPHWLVSATAV